MSARLTSPRPEPAHIARLKTARMLAKLMLSGMELMATITTRWKRWSKGPELAGAAFLLIGVAMTTLNLWGALLGYHNTRTRTFSSMQTLTG